MWGRVSEFDWWMLALLALFAWVFPNAGDVWFHAVEDFFGRLARRKRLSVIALGVTAILLRLALLPAVSVPSPGIHDEFSYLLAADTFAHGRLANPPHPMWLSFESFHENGFPTYSSIFPPGQGIALAIGELLGQPWIGVLLSVAVMCAAICWMLQAWLPAEWAFLGAFLATLRFATFSYWVNSYWGGAVAAIGGALAIGAFGRIRHSWRARDAVILGAGIAILANSRPLEGFIFSIPIAIALVLWLAGKESPPKRILWRSLVLPLAVVLCAAAGWMAYYNWRVTANPLLLPHELNQRMYHTEPLFVWQTAQPAHSYDNRQFDFFYNVWARSQYHRTLTDLKLVTVNKFENFWAVFLGPVTVLPALMLPYLILDKRTRLLSAIFVVGWLGLIGVVWSMPHYAAPLTAVIFGLLIQAMRHLRQMRFGTRPVGLAWTRVSVVMAIVTFGTCLFTTIQHPYLWSCGFGPGNLERAKLIQQLDKQPGQHLIMVRYTPHHNIHDEWVYNGADIDSSKVIWARELQTDQDARLLQYYRTRHVWLLQPDKNRTALVPYAILQAPPR